MRKLLILMLVVLLAVGLVAVGCGGGGGAPEGEKGGQSEAEQAEYANFPERPIEMIIPYKPGGASDVLFRLIAQYAEKQLGQPLVPINMPGATSTVGSRHVKEAKPDGYTILASHDVIATAYYSGVVDYNFFDFEPICLMTSTENVLTVRGDAEWETLDDFYNYVKNNPGKVNWGCTMGSTDHFFIAGAMDAAGIPLDYLNLVPYEGTGPMYNALLAKQIDGGMGNISSGKGYYEDGSMKPLAIAAEERFPGFDIPTFKEQGYDFVHATNRGFFAPKGTPEPILKKIDEAVGKAMQDPELQEKIKELGTQVNYKPREEYIEFLHELDSKMAKWAEEMFEKKE